MTVVEKFALALLLARVGSELVRVRAHECWMKLERLPASELASHPAIVHSLFVAREGGATRAEIETMMVNTRTVDASEARQILNDVLGASNELAK